MAAATVAFSLISGEDVERWGRRKARIATLTMVASTSTYVDGGLADATNYTAAFALKLGFNSIQRVVPITMLRLSTFENAFPFEVDMTNRKVVLYGGATTAAEDKNLEEIPNGASITDGTYTATVLLIGR